MKHLNADYSFGDPLPPYDEWQQVFSDAQRQTVDNVRSAMVRNQGKLAISHLVSARLAESGIFNYGNGSELLRGQINLAAANNKLPYFDVSDHQNTLVDNESKYTSYLIIKSALGSI